MAEVRAEMTSYIVLTRLSALEGKGFHRGGKWYCVA